MLRKGFLRAVPTYKPHDLPKNQWGCPRHADAPGMLGFDDPVPLLGDATGMLGFADPVPLLGDATGMLGFADPVPLV